MSDLANTFSNPWVLGGGAALGLVMLMMAKTKTNQGTANDVATAYGLPASVVGQYNIAALGAVTQQAAIAADVGKAALAADTTKQVAVLDAIKNMNTNAAVVQQAAITSGAGIINTQIQTQGATIIDAMNNTNRLSLAQEQTIQSIHHDNATVQAAQIQAKAARNASNNALLGKVLGIGASIIAAPFTGGASLAGMPAFLGSNGISGSETAIAA